MNKGLLNGKTNYMKSFDKMRDEQNNSHKPVFSGKQLTCQCEAPTGRTVTADFENQICESCARLVACATAKEGQTGE